MGRRRAACHRARQVLRDSPGVAVRIGEGERAHAPVTIRRAADHRHSVLFQLSSHRIHVRNDDAELPDTLPRQAEHSPAGAFW